MIYAESRGLIRVINYEVDDFLELTNKTLGNYDDQIKGVMYYRKINKKIILLYVHYKGKEVKKGELTIKMLKEIQHENRRRNTYLEKLVNDFNLLK